MRPSIHGLVVFVKQRFQIVAVRLIDASEASVNVGLTKQRRCLVAS